MRRERFSNTFDLDRQSVAFESFVANETQNCTESTQERQYAFRQKYGRILRVASFAEKLSSQYSKRSSIMMRDDAGCTHDERSSSDTERETPRVVSFFERFECYTPSICFVGALLPLRYIRSVREPPRVFRESRVPTWRTETSDVEDGCGPNASLKIVARPQLVFNAMFVSLLHANVFENLLVVFSFVRYESFAHDVSLSGFARCPSDIRHGRARRGRCNVTLAPLKLASVLTSCVVSVPSAFVANVELLLYKSSAEFDHFCSDK